MNDTIELSHEKKKLAAQLSEQAQNCRTPLKFVDNWYALSEQTVEWNEDRGEKMKEVPVDKIVGTCPQNIHRFQPYRFQKVLKKLAMGEWREEVGKPEAPHFKQVGDFYYIGSDGTHRALAFKALGIEKLYARVTYYDIIHEAGIPHKHLRKTQREETRRLQEQRLKE